jgi:hypothetical protein
MGSYAVEVRNQFKSPYHESLNHQYQLSCTFGQDFLLIIPTLNVVVLDLWPFEVMILLLSVVLLGSSRSALIFTSCRTLCAVILPQAFVFFSVYDGAIHLANFKVNYFGDDSPELSAMAFTIAIVA